MRMPRTWSGSLLALVAALIMAACGRPPAAPSPPTGGGNGPNGGPPPPPPVVNTPPQIKSIVASDTRVEVGTPITLTATVEDLETPVASLEYRWSAETGTFTGNGAVVTWSPAADAKTPADYVITLTVVETFPSSVVGSIVLENKATSTLTAHVNNSPKELAELSLRFLGDFANSRVSPEKCVSEFSDGCSGKKDELQDITANRHDFEILASTLRHTGVQIAPTRTAATVHTFCAFTSRVITPTPQSEGCKNDPSACGFNSVQSVQGNCLTTSVYDKGRWWLCTSNFLPSGVATAFERAFFGIRRHELH
jgi:hypothetical protein